MNKVNGTKREEEYTLTPEQDAELERRMALDAKGLVKYSSWEDVKARILSKKENDLFLYPIS